MDDDVSPAPGRLCFAGYCVDGYSTDIIYFILQVTSSLLSSHKVSSKLRASPYRGQKQPEVRVIDTTARQNAPTGDIMLRLGTRLTI